MIIIFQRGQQWMSGSMVRWRTRGHLTKHVFSLNFWLLRNSIWTLNIKDSVSHKHSLLFFFAFGYLKHECRRHLVLYLRKLCYMMFILLKTLMCSIIFETKIPKAFHLMSHLIQSSVDVFLHRNWDSGYVFFLSTISSITY